MAKRLTITDLLAQKEQLKGKKQQRQSLYIESLDANIIIQEPTRAIALEGLEMGQDPSRSDMGDVHIVYHCVVEPNLKDADLQKEFGCVEPTDIVEMIFRPGEISAISGHALQLAGYGRGVTKADDEVKN